MWESKFGIFYLAKHAEREHACCGSDDKILCIGSILSVLLNNVDSDIMFQIHKNQFGVMEKTTGTYVKNDFVDFTIKKLYYTNKIYTRK